MDTEITEKSEDQHKRLRTARERVFPTAAEAARAMAVNIATYTHHENGTRGYGEAEARLYARRLKTTPEYLLLGISATGRDGGIREVDATAGAGGGGLGELIIQHKSGYTVTADAVRDIWQIPDSFLRGELRAEASTTWIVEVRGDSGYDPTSPHAPGSVHSGDRVIIDTRDRNPSPPGPFAVFDGVGLVLKLVEIVPRSDPVRLRLSSRNPGYSPYEVTSEEAHIIGRVVGRISRM